VVSAPIEIRIVSWSPRDVAALISTSNSAGGRVRRGGSRGWLSASSFSADFCSRDQRGWHGFIDQHINLNAFTKSSAENGCPAAAIQAKESRNSMSNSNIPPPSNGNYDKSPSAINAPNNQGIVTIGQQGNNTLTLVAPIDRHLTPLQATKIKDQCAGLPPVPVTAANSNFEAQAFGMDIVNALRAGGCHADLSLPIPGLTPDVKGIIVGLRQSAVDSAQPPAAAVQLHDLLAMAGLKVVYTAMKEDFFPGVEFVLVVGAR
jgi:hypothetical protein